MYERMLQIDFKNIIRGVRNDRTRNYKTHQ